MQYPYHDVLIWIALNKTPKDEGLKEQNQKKTLHKIAATFLIRTMKDQTNNLRHYNSAEAATPKKFKN